MTGRMLGPAAGGIGVAGHLVGERSAAVAPAAPPPPAALLLTWGLGLTVLGGMMYWAPVTTAQVLTLVGIGAPAVWLAWRHPEVGLLAMSFFTAAFIPRTMVTFSLGGLRLDPADMTLLGLLALMVARGARRKTMVVPWWSITGPLVAYAGVAVFSALYARFYQGVQLGLAVGELRPAVYAAGCALAAATLVRRGQIAILLAGLFVLADLTAGVVIAQQFAGPGARLVPGMESGVWQVDQMAGSGFGAVRVVPPGHVLMYWMANVAFCLLLGSPGPLRRPGWRALLALQLVYLGLASLLTYTRAQWIASTIALLLACAVAPRAAKQRMGRLVLVAAPFVMLAVALAGTGLVPLVPAGAGGALTTRITSIFSPDDTLSTDSLEWRLFENEQALKALAERPFFGVGVGNDYRDVTLLGGEAAGWQWDLNGDGRLTRWVHNSYLYVAVKMGLVAIAAFVWFGVAFLAGGALAYFGAPDGPARLIVLATVCSFAGLLEWAVFEAHLMLPPSMTTLGLMVGVVAAVGSNGCRRGGMVDAGLKQGGGWPARSGGWPARSAVP